MYRHESMPDMLKAMIDSDAAAEAGVNVRSAVVDTPAHTIYALVEADSVAAVSRWVFSMPLRQHAEISAVEDLADVAERAKAMLESS
jgi:hypothetical protein